MATAEPLEDACHRAESLIVRGAPTRDVLDCLIDAAESLAPPGAVSSILVIDEQGVLRNGHSPGLPNDYLMAIDGLRPHPQVGTCAAAAATASVVVTHDFLTDDKWAELRHLPHSLGFVGAWSMPIVSRRSGTVVGTFGTYFRERREPSTREIEAVRRLASIAAQAIER